MSVITMSILIIFAGLLIITALYPKQLQSGAWKYIYWFVILLRIFLVCLCLLCLLTIAIGEILSGGICEKITGDNFGPLAKATSPNGQCFAFVEGEFCHGLMAGGETTQEYTVSAKKKAASETIQTKIMFYNDSPRIDLIWQDDHTLIIQGISRPAENYGEVHFIYKDHKMNERKKISTIQLHRK